MSFTTNVLRNGEWVTQQVDLRSILKGTSTVKSLKKQRATKPNQCGLLSQTIVESPHVNFVLPVRLRTDVNNDVVFIGDHYVIVRELLRDGQVVDIIKKNDFGSRIRNAAVIGGSFSIPELSRFEERNFDMRTAGHVAVKTEDSGTSFGSSQQDGENGVSFSPFPSQLLLLVLESGDCVFLFVKTASDGPQFVTSSFQNPGTDFVYPGFHVAVDPSSRYMALACTENFFAVYELDSLATLGERYKKDQPLRPVCSFRGRSLPGVIHKMVFLYPGPEEKEHIILLMIVVHNGTSRTVTYDWKLGDDLRAVLSEAKTGLRLPVEYQMPHLILPLTVQSAFMTICSDRIAIVTQMMQGQPCFTQLILDSKDHKPNAPMNRHHGRHAPLFTAWARPVRQGNYFIDHDCFYLAREDGVVRYIQAESDASANCTFLPEELDINISSAFTCTFDPYGDVLVVGGDASPGGVWRLHPRKRPSELLKSLPNWTPALDLVTTHESKSWNQAAAAGTAKVGGWQQRKVARPDQMFAASGRGLQGCITEYRQGLEASILADIEFGDAVHEAWVCAHANGSKGFFYLLLCMPDRSAVLQLSSDLSDVNEPDPETVHFDLSSRTLAYAYTSSQLAVQATEQSITILSTERSAKFLYGEMMPGLSPTTISVSDAAVWDHLLAIAAHTETEYHIHVFRLDAVSLTLSRVRSFESLHGEVTCLSLCPHFGLLVGIWQNGRPILARHLNDNSTELLTTDLYDRLSRSVSADRLECVQAMDAICSIVSFPGLVVLGTRSGEVVTITELPASPSMPCVQLENVGNTMVKVTRANLRRDDDSPAVFVCCDSALVLFSEPKPAGSINAGRFSRRRQIWPLDTSDKHGSSPQVDFAIVANVYGASTITMPILMLSGKRILLTRLSHKNSLVPRHMPIGGTPTKMVFSHYLQCLVVAVTKDDRPTLAFLDPTSGADLGRPTDKNGELVDFVSGLGREGDKIFGLSEWEIKKNGSTWHFILVSTKDSRVLVVSTERMQSADEADSPTAKPLPIRYWTRFKQSFERPVYSILGSNEGLVYCVGTTLHFDFMDTVEKKLKLLQKFDLGSPATSLAIMNERIVALTDRDSLQIIDPPSIPDSGTSDEPGLRHADSKPRNTVHMIEVAGPRAEDPLGNLLLVADRECQVAVLWVPWQNQGRDCETVLVADLPASVRKFRRGSTRPIWSGRGQSRDSSRLDRGADVPRYGRLIGSWDDAEVLGMCLDGSMQHLTLLRLDAWRLLRFIQNLAARSEEICPFTYSKHSHETGAEFDPEPILTKGEQLHVDGDILGRCLEKRALHRLVASPPYLSRLIELLDGLDGGRHTAEFAHGPKAAETAAQASDKLIDDEASTGLGERRASQYLGLAYDVLEYFLAPVF